MTARHLTILSMLAGTGLIVPPMFNRPDIRFIWNALGSVPVGLYRIEPVGRIEVTDLVAVMPPEPLAGFLAGRDYLAHTTTPMARPARLTRSAVICRHGTAAGRLPRARCS